MTCFIVKIANTGVREFEYEEDKKSRSTRTCIPRVVWGMVAVNSRDNKSWKSNNPRFKSEVPMLTTSAVCEQGWIN